MEWDVMGDEEDGVESCLARCCLKGNPGMWRLRG